MSNVFYGGGHRMKSSYDFVFWCLRTTAIYYSPKDALVIPRAPLGEQQTYQRIVGCAEQTGVSMISTYRELLAACQEEGRMLSIAEGLRTRGAILFNQGAVIVSLGDSRRVIYEEDFRLIMKYLNETQDARNLFEYAAKIPGVEYP